MNQSKPTAVPSAAEVVTRVLERIRLAENAVEDDKLDRFDEVCESSGGFIKRKAMTMGQRERWHIGIFLKIENSIQIFRYYLNYYFLNQLICAEKSGSMSVCARYKTSIRKPGILITMVFN